MEQAPEPAGKGRYVLATGGAAAYRLGLLHALYGPGTRQLLLDAGARPGLHAADIGCGIGTVTALLAELVGPAGHVTGIDASRQQLDQAASRLADRAGSVTFVEASATGTGLPPGRFDLIYCRFLLMHLTDPVSALREMARLLKPGGVLVCEDGDLTNAGSEPPSALDAFADLFGRLGPVKGVDYTLGRRLYHLIRDLGFASPEVRFNQPVRVRGEEKRLLELSVLEAGQGFIDAGLITPTVLDQTLAEMRQLVADDRVLAVMPRMTQVWARKPSAG
jgi:SAM-dependent methyltransferase